MVVTTVASMGTPTFVSICQVQHLRLPHKEAGKFKKKKKKKKRERKERKKAQGDLSTRGERGVWGRLYLQSEMSLGE